MDLLNHQISLHWIPKDLFNLGEDTLCPVGAKCGSGSFNLGARHNWFEQLINRRGGWAISL